MQIPDCWLWTIFLGFAVGFLSGLFGIGGGFLLVPLLRAGFGIPYNIAVGSSLCQMVFSSSAGTIKHFKKNHINIKLGLLLLFGSIPGAEIGASVLQFFKKTAIVTIFGHSVVSMDFFMNIMYLILLLSIFFIMFREVKQWQSRTGGEIKNLKRYKIRFFLNPVYKVKYKTDFSEHTELFINAGFVVVLGIAVGFLSGVLGIGGSIIFIPVVICLFKIPAALAVGTGLFQIIFTSFYGTITHIVKDNVSFVLAGLLVCGSMPGALVGAVLTEKIRGRKIRLYFSIIILAVSIIVFIQLMKSFIK
ncbi:MAG: sulfite exporter TauE/SafE family protein [Elusimicrobia bacterium]|nr:sulfite exporter TauE/SafE family protein [Elusimicrobiota bacterium]